MFDIRRYRTLDIVIVVVAVLVLATGAFLGFTLWRQSQQVVQSTPAARAIDALIAEVRKNPNNVDIRMQLAQALSVAGRNDEAVKQYQELLKINEDFVPALSGIGFEAMKRQDWKTGETYFKQVIDLLEGNGKPTQSLETAYFYLGNAYMEQKRYEDAVGAFKAALRIRRDASDTYFLLANSYKQLELPDAQREALDNALTFDPKMPEANFEYGLLELAAGNKASAAEHFRAAADAAPGEPLPLEQLDKFGEAAPYLAKAKALVKSDRKAALEQARIAVAIEPRDVAAVIYLGKLYQGNLMRTEAAEMFRRALVLDPENAEAKAALKAVTDGS